MSKSSQIKLARTAHGLSTTELSYRLGISQSSVVRLEQSEERETISLAALKRAAEALGCELAYKLVPKRELISDDKREYPGLTRRRVGYQGRTKSGVNMKLEHEEVRANRGLSAEDRLKRAFALSDFTRELGQCFKKP